MIHLIPDTGMVGFFIGHINPRIRGHQEQDIERLSGAPMVNQKGASILPSTWFT